MVKNKTNKLIKPLKIIGWWEEYKCGCSSKTVRFKKDLIGYCGKCGHNRLHIYPEFKD
jgi:hypothetical protein